MAPPLKTVQVGLGPIGREVARHAARHRAMELVGAADLDPAWVGRDLGEVLEIGSNGIPVVDSISALLDGTKPDVVLHATGSFLPDVESQLRECLERGASVVSTCEELSYPFYRHPKLAAALDAHARAHDAVLLGTGVNPGFVMDKLVATTAAACSRVDRVRVLRVVDAGLRRVPFQNKVGAGLELEEFEKKRAAGGMGHIGLPESAHMVADVIGVSGRRTLRDELRPIVADGPVRSGTAQIEAGRVAGVHQILTLEADGEEKVRLEVELYVGAERPRDTFSIEGEPPLEVSLPGGVPGDSATAAVTIHCALRVKDLAPGLRTVLDVPVRFGGIVP